MKTGMRSLATHGLSAPRCTTEAPSGGALLRCCRRSPGTRTPPTGLNSKNTRNSKRDSLWVIISKLLNHCLRFLLLLLGVAAGSTPLRAERFISIPEAQRLCFTNANRFDELNLRLTRDDVKAIESTTRARVRNPAPKVWRAW